MEQRQRRARRAFSEEFKARTVELIESSGKSVGAVCRELDLSETAVRRWVRQTGIDAGEVRGLTTEERAELARLRRENPVLREEREILKKAAAFFAKETTVSRYRFIAAEEASYPVALCRVLGVARCGLLRLAARPPSARGREDERLAERHRGDPSAESRDLRQPARPRRACGKGPARTQARRPADAPGGAAGGHRGRLPADDGADPRAPRPPIWWTPLHGGAPDRPVGRRHHVRSRPGKAGCIWRSSSTACSRKVVGWAMARRPAHRVGAARFDLALRRRHVPPAGWCTTPTGSQYTAVCGSKPAGSGDGPSMGGWATATTTRWPRSFFADPQGRAHGS